MALAGPDGRPSEPFTWSCVVATFGYPLAVAVAVAVAAGVRAGLGVGLLHAAATRQIAAAVRDLVVAPLAGPIPPRRVDLWWVEVLTTTEAGRLPHCAVLEAGRPGRVPVLG